MAELELVCVPTRILTEKDDIVEFYTKQYRQMLSDNLTDYAQNFDKYVQLNKEDKPAQ